MITSWPYWLFLATAVITFWKLPAGWRTRLLVVAWVGCLATCRLFETLWLVLVACSAHALLRRPALAAGIGCLALIVGISVLLVWFKAPPSLAARVAAPEDPVAAIAGPLGFSYFAFKLIHVVVEVRRRTVTVPGLGEFLNYLFFVPMFTAGPIERLDRFLTHRDSTWQRALWVEGGTRIVHGLIKKLFLAESACRQGLALLGEGHEGFQLLEQPVANVWLYVAISYLRIYFDFSAYSDIAIGTARLFGYRLMENFDWPIFAWSPSDYWRRWHISLSAWCQSYAYMPVLGWTRNPFIGTFCAFLIMGQWHLVGWNRAVWTLYVTLGLSAYMVWNRRMGRPRPGSFRAGWVWRCVSVGLTQVLILGAVAFILHGELQPWHESLRILGRMSGWTFNR